MRDLVEHQDVEHDIDLDVEDDEFNSEIVVTDHGFCTISLFLQPTAGVILDHGNIFSIQITLMFQLC